MNQSIEETIKEREGTHGSWSEGCHVSQALKNAMKLGTPKNLINDTQNEITKEGISRICMKLSRIAVGNPLEPEHWHDIAGYAKLVEEELRKPTATGIMRPIGGTRTEDC